MHGIVLNREDNREARAGGSEKERKKRKSERNIQRKKIFEILEIAIEKRKNLKGCLTSPGFLPRFSSSIRFSMAGSQFPIARFSPRSVRGTQSSPPPRCVATPPTTCASNLALTVSLSLSPLSSSGREYDGRTRPKHDRSGWPHRSRWLGERRAFSLACRRTIYRDEKPTLRGSIPV